MLTFSLALAAGMLAIINGVVYFRGKLGNGNVNGDLFISDDKNTTILSKTPLQKNAYSPFTYLDKKTDMMHRKLQRIEYSLIGLNGKNGNGKADASLGKKIERLEEFKRNAEIEIRALRDALEESGINPNKIKDSRILDDHIEKKVHSLAFNSHGKK